MSKGNIVLMYSTHNPSREHLQKLKRIAKGYEIIVANTEAEAIKAAPAAKIILGHRFLKQIVPYAHKLVWVQTSAGGIDRLPLSLLKGKKVTLTRTTTAVNTIALHAYALVLALIRNIPGCVKRQLEQNWDPELKMNKYPKKVIILGYGAVGEVLAKMIKPIGVSIYGVKRKAVNRSKKYCQRIITDNSWVKELFNTDVLINLLPMNKTTNLLVNSDVINSLSKNAVIVNVGREETMDTEAVMEALRKGKIAGAALDVINPLVLNKKGLWGVPNLIITPYIAAKYKNRGKDIEYFVEKQVERFLTGIKLKNIIKWEDIESDYVC